MIIMGELTTSNLKEYKNFLDQVTTQIRTAHIRATQLVNKELVVLYKTLGEHIVHNQEKYGWGKSVVEQLSKDLKKIFGRKFGFSPQNFWYMRQFIRNLQVNPKIRGSSN